MSLQPIREVTGELVELHAESSLIEWAKEAHEAHKIAVSLAKTAFVSTTLRGKPEEVTGAILTGHEVGLRPMAAVRSIDVIQGTPAMRAVAMRALVQSAGHDLWVEETTLTRAVVCGKRRGSEHVQKSVWTIDRAKRLGLTSKDNWTKQPDAMLIARATAECCRLIAADVLLGLPYAVEEVQDLEPDVEAPKKRTAKRAPLPEVEPPALEEPVAPETPEEKAAEAATDQGDDVCPGCGGELHDSFACPNAPADPE